MNRKKKVTKKFVFEPKAPSEEVKEVSVEEKEEEVTNNLYNTDALKGKFGPLIVDGTEKEEKVNRNKCIICIPELKEGMKFVVFEDDSFGIRIGEEIYKLSSFRGSQGIIVEHKDVLYKRGDVETFLMY